MRFEQSTTGNQSSLTEEKQAGGNTHAIEKALANMARCRLVWKIESSGVGATLGSSCCGYNCLHIMSTTAPQQVAELGVEHMAITAEQAAINAVQAATNEVRAATNALQAATE